MSQDPAGETVAVTRLSRRAKPAPATRARKLPHIQRAGKPLFVTFVTQKRWILPESVRQIVLDHCLHDHLAQYEMHAAVIMPDHVHLLFTPLEDDDTNTFGLSQITNSIKGASAHAVNRALGRKGPVWQQEWFDRILRSDESVRNTADYICANPIRTGLAVDEDTYPWLWRSWSIPA